MQKILAILLLGFVLKIQAQDSLNFFKPNILSNHPLGIFTSRINHNFKYKPTKKSISFNISRGNVWLPHVENRLVNSQADREHLNNYVWHRRIWQMDSLGITNYKSRSMQADGIISTYLLTFKSPLSKKIDIHSNIRLNSLTGGKVPVALLTSDEFIEWFHSNIAGGEDAFGRKTAPFGKAGIKYSDINNNEINLKNNDLLISEISNYINYYPNRIFKGLSFNLSALTSVSQMNKKWHFDLGFSGSAIKQFQYKKNWLDWGISSGLLLPSVFQEQAVIINNLNYLFSFESHWNYVIPTKNNHQWILGLNFHMQSNFHTRAENDYNVIYGAGNTSHDHYGVSHLNRWLQGWSMIVGRNWKNWSVHTYLREDFWVDNAPDAQVGWGIQRVF